MRNEGATFSFTGTGSWAGEYMYVYNIHTCDINTMFVIQYYFLPRLGIGINCVQVL